MNQDQSYWEQQKKGQWKTLTDPLKNDPEIHSEIDNLITTFYWKFREKKGMPKGTYEPEIEFLGFKKFKDFSDRAGHCKLKTSIKRKWQAYSNGEEVEGSETKTYYAKLSISLHQQFLLDKLGMDKLFSNERVYTPVGFNELIGTIAHELAHAFQNTVNLKKEEEEKSQCESTGARDANGNLLHPELAAEHTALTKEIKQMIESSTEYQEFKKWWREGKSKRITSERKIKKATSKIGDTSSKMVKKTGEGLGKAGKNLEESANQDKWPRWVLPVGIVIGALLLIGIIIWIFRKKEES